MTQPQPQRVTLLAPLRRHLRAALRAALARWIDAGRINPMEPDSALDDPATPAVGELVRAGHLVDLRAQIPANRPAFQRWYADEEIARLLRHDLRPLNEVQSRGYFDTIILPLSAVGTCWAIHEAATDRLIGSTALTDFTGGDRRSALFRLVIGEKDCWGRGYGTEATRLAIEEAFKHHGCTEVRLEVFRHNARAIGAYRRVGFKVTGEHIEYVGRDRYELHVVEMVLSQNEYRESAVPSACPDRGAASADPPTR
ncbi:MAG: GNAT family N-acetyltransferase [Thermomicrobiales bacterium]